MAVYVEADRLAVEVDPVQVGSAVQRVPEIDGAAGLIPTVRIVGIGVRVRGLVGRAVRDCRFVAQYLQHVELSGGRPADIRDVGTEKPEGGPDASADRGRDGRLDIGSGRDDNL